MGIKYYAKTSEDQLSKTKSLRDGAVDSNTQLTTKLSQLIKQPP
jgi:hypothetical protein